jgi:hypothetical protein
VPKDQLLREAKEVSSALETSPLKDGFNLVYRTFKSETIIFARLHTIKPTTAILLL